MKFFRPQGAEKDKPDRLFVVTARHKAMILEAEGGAGQGLEIVTKVKFDFSLHLLIQFTSFRLSAILISLFYFFGSGTW